MGPKVRRAVIDAVTALAEAFGRQTTEATFRAYAIGLDGIPDAAVERAAMLALRANKFMPAPSELRQLAGEIPAEARAIKAWQAVAQAVAAHGYYDSVDFDDPVVNATLRNMGGWERFCERLDSDEEKWIRRDFDRIYSSLMAAGVGPHEAAPLGGCIARENAANGYLEHIPPVALIECGLPPHAPGVLRLPRPAAERVKSLAVALAVDIGKMP